MKTKHIVTRIISTPHGGGLSIPIKLFDNPEAAQKFAAELNGAVQTSLDAWVLAANSPGGLVPVGPSAKQFLIDMMGGPFNLKHVIFSVDEHSANLVEPATLILDASGRPV